MIDKIVKDTPKRLLNDCFLHDKDRLRHDEVLKILEKNLNTISKIEQLETEQANGRFLAADVIAPRNVPFHDNAAVDGFAFNHQDYLSRNGKTYKISSRFAAGKSERQRLVGETACRIFTGAAVPVGADCIVMQEDCTIDENNQTVTIPTGLKLGANLRKSGEDTRADDIVVKKGTRLRPQEIAAIASLGFSNISVFEKLRIAIVSTGDELLDPEDGKDLAYGQVFDSNRAMLKTLCETLPVHISDLGIVQDNANEIEQTIKEAATTHDLIMTTGGASRGEEDHIISTIDKIGKRHLWQIAIKPGRPMSFGQINGKNNDCVFLALPGNPVAAFTCFLLYAQFSMRILAGGNSLTVLKFKVPAAFEIRHKKTDRREFLRGWLEQDENGTFQAHKFKKDGSGLISGLRQATGFIELSEEIEKVQYGDQISFTPFSAFGITE